MTDKLYGHPEPVPPASQLAVLPFVAAVDGLLREDDDVPGLRITIHRTMNREDEGYLQQVCAYLRGDSVDWRALVGRIFPVNEGIMGAAYEDGHIWRTKRYRTTEDLRSDLQTTMPRAGDDRAPEQVPVAYLAIPFLGPQEQVVLILYADCDELNFFADDDRIRRVVAMCKGLCRLLDGLQKDPFPNFRNFPLQKGRPVTGHRTAYGVQERVDSIEPPRFSEVTSFNYEVAVA